MASFLTCLRSFPCSSAQAGEVKEGSPEGTGNNLGVQKGGLFRECLFSSSPR